MKRSRPLFIVPALLLLFIAATRHSARRFQGADVPEPMPQAPGLQGTYALEGPAQETILAAINNGTAYMNFIKRPIARSRLKKTTLPAYAWVRIEYTAQQVSIVRAGLKPIVTPADGKSIKWTREDGETFDVNTVWDEGKLKQTFVASDGSRENLFALGPDGNAMTIQVTLRSPKLRQPIVYQLSYRRKA